jgi:hypothetical protein
MKKINRFFWWCAGANIDILEDCPTDHSKYFGVGGTIVFTALMASFAGGYAFFTAFKNPWMSVFFGTFWGLLIFNLDRYIVSTIGKGDGTQKITKEEWKIAAPRLLMACLLGFVIATPLELKIFETEIQTVVERLKIDKAEDLKGRDVSFNADLDELKLRRTTLESDIKELTNNKKQLSDNAGEFYKSKILDQQTDLKNKESELAVVQQKVNNLHSEYITGIKDSLSSETIERRHSKYKKKGDIRNTIRKDRNSIQKSLQNIIDNQGSAMLEEASKIDKQIALKTQEVESLYGNIKSKETTKDNRNTNYDNKVENYDGFAAHLEAMSILTSEKNAIFWAKWLITFLFIFIEIAPVLFKLMAESGPYDDIMDRIKHESSVREKQRMSDINDEINTSIKISSAKNQIRLDAELKGNKALLDKIALAQAEIAEMAVERWREEELKKLNLGVSHIINTNQQKQLNSEEE